MTKTKILFFGSGDFPVPTFEYIINHLNDKYEIAGLITSKDKPTYHHYRLYDLALQHNIPIHIPQNLESDETYEWCKEKDADVFCVISYKKLPQRIYTLPKGCAFNVHASLLPFLKGASPIYWAIVYGFKETGLTSFILNDKIDCGNIICNQVEKIEPNETFGTLFQKLMISCIDITKNTLEKIGNKTEEELIKENKLFYQPTSFHFDKAPKKRLGGKGVVLYGFSMFERIFRASLPQNGLRILLKATICGGTDEKYLFDRHYKTYELILWDYEIKTKDEIEYFDTTPVETDGKTFFNIHFNGYDKYLSIKELQLQGKKRMGVEEFLRGFQVARRNGIVLNVC